MDYREGGGGESIWWIRERGGNQSGGLERVGNQWRGENG